MILEPFALIALAVGKAIGAIALATSTHILALIDITVGKLCAATAVGLALEELTLILASVAKRVVAYRDLLCLGRGRCYQSQCCYSQAEVFMCHCRMLEKE